jgi:hypothetical protein
MPGAPSTNSDVIASTNEATSSQNDMLLSLGKAMSGAPIINGTNQLPNPPIIAGMTMKKIMIRACEVKKTLYMFLAASTVPSPVMTCEITGNTWIPGNINSARMAIERSAPITPAQTAKTR